MLQSSRAGQDQGGFTLLEILVALVLIGLLAGALVPAVLNQLNKGETGRVVEDLYTTENAAKAFRVDVKRWPGDIGDLYTRPTTTTDSMITAQPYPAGLVNFWQGPYLERGSASAAGLPTGAGGTLVDNFGTSSGRLVVRVTGLDSAQIIQVNAAIDGANETTATAGTSGQIRWNSAATPTLEYIGAALQ